METIKNIASDFLDDAIDQAKSDERKFSDWYEFVEDAFSMAASNNTLPGYDNEETAFNVLSDNRVFVGEFLERNGSDSLVNPFLNPTGFLVYIVTLTAEEMADEFVDDFAEIRE